MFWLISAYTNQSCSEKLFFFTVQDIAVSAVATVSQLLSASHGMYSSVDQAAINE